MYKFYEIIESDRTTDKMAVNVVQENNDGIFIIWPLQKIEAKAPVSPEDLFSPPAVVMKEFGTYIFCDFSVDTMSFLENYKRKNKGKEIVGIQIMGTFNNIKIFRDYKRMTSASN